MTKAVNSPNPKIQRTDHRGYNQTMSSSRSTMTAIESEATSIATAYKGKVSHRSWPQLPEELVRHIATFYLWDRGATVYVPTTWDLREHWHQRMVYTSIRDAYDLERNLMQICPQWGQALQSHFFWQRAVELIDPLNSLAHFADVQPTNNNSSAPTQPIRLSPYHHYRSILNCSCVICRINTPIVNQGLANAKRTVNSLFINPIAVCVVHDPNPDNLAPFCGLCLREGLHSENTTGNAYTVGVQAAVLQNEDENTWPGIQATCRNCRQEWLWRKASQTLRTREAVIGIRGIPLDWETKQTVEGFVELAEGTLDDVMTLALEKWWLRKFTRLCDMMKEAVAARKFDSSPERLRSDLDYDQYEEEEEDEEDDPDLLQFDESTVKHLVLGDWARARILDGLWNSPYDIKCRNLVPGQQHVVRALHPCPWTEEAGNLGQHPTRPIVESEMPPTAALCDHATSSYVHQMHTILTPAMKNIVRKVVIECALSDEPEDPTIKVARMTLEEVARILREEEGVWYEGYDWIERRRNDEETRRSKSESIRVAGRLEEDATSITSGSGSCEESIRSGSGSATTSPVLSTSTLQTTPSPPPLTDEGIGGGENKKKESTSPSSEESDSSSVSPVPASVSLVVANRVAIPVAPVLNPPRILRPIPHIPVTLAHLPKLSLETFQHVWRDACRPLYHCRCTICERAMTAENDAKLRAQGINPDDVRDLPPHQEQQRQERTLSPVPTTTVTEEEEEEEEEEGRERGHGRIELEEISELEDVVSDVGVEADEEEEEDDEDEDDDEDDDNEEDQEEEVEEVDGVEVVSERERDSPSETESASRSDVLLRSSRKRSCDDLEECEERTREDSPPKKVRKEMVELTMTNAIPANNRGRKRSCSESEDEDIEDRRDQEREESHPKKARTEEYQHEVQLQLQSRPRPQSQPQRIQRKRSSEELDDLEVVEINKKMKIDKGKDVRVGGTGEIGSLSPAVWTKSEVEGNTVVGSISPRILPLPSPPRTVPSPRIPTVTIPTSTFPTSTIPTSGVQERIVTLDGDATAVYGEKEIEWYNAVTLEKALEASLRDVSGAGMGGFDGDLEERI